jgi:hypothetical protein
MRQILKSTFLVLLAMLFSAAPSWAQRGGHGGGGHSSGRSSGGSSGGQTVHVRGYTKKDGTYVAPHDRRAPGTAPETETGSSSTRTRATNEYGDLEKDPVETHAPSTKTSAWAAGVAGAAFVQTSPHYSTETGWNPPRDSHGRIRRSSSARHEFETLTGYSHGRPGYVIDHIIPLACGGADSPSNMQWQTVDAAKIKDRTERVGCGTHR